MVKYSENLKKKVVQEYLEGKVGYKQLANKYRIKNLANIQGWVQNHTTFGLSGIKRHKKPN
ncbi:transposase [Listeria monocytogenes]|nr:transposase [Listeria monocytogenes]